MPARMECSTSDNTLEIGSAVLWCQENIYLKEAKFLKNGFNFHLMTFFEATRWKFQVLLKIIE